MNHEQNSPKPSQGPRLVRQLESWKKQKALGVFADLRSGLGKKPGEAMRMFPHLAQFIEGSDAQIQATLLTASLYSFKRNHTTQKKTLAMALRECVPEGTNPEESFISRRLAAALDADREELWYHLQSLVQIVNDKGHDLNWSVFYSNVRTFLGNDEEEINRQRLAWARQFWGPNPKNQSEGESDSASKTSIENHEQ